ncbi:leucine zipper domain-containing protein [Streptomyces coeruleorubidus]|uniref:Leucine zipper domain-containing protein n=1 Tax=Streptomyces coeruleorubidus TaxID=116188 RepID=A0ABZ0KPQ1_STRC4|nr:MULTISPECIES: leucine zipper domain-containing protein [Streptomyces]WOT39584.1 leucine zipper domain-containing protein [Streptomyces coeruleorubidus]GGU46555.1 hypothetical protein GCM10010244_85460 [Streptomyces bellus]
MSHRNAPLTPTGRLRLARCVVDDGWPLRRAAERFQVSHTTAARWAGRYRQLGAAGMRDRSSRPHHSPHQTPATVEQQVLRLRREHRIGPVRLAARCGIAASTAHRTCKDALGAGIQARLDKVSQEYDRMLTELHERAPKAKILTVGYPTIVPQDASKCGYGDLTKFGTITQGDLNWLRQDVLEPLNKTIENSTGTQDTASFINLYTPSQDHSVCDDTKWVEGFVTLPDQLSFVHPNALGHRNAADHIEEAMLNTIS